MSGAGESLAPWDILREERGAQWRRPSDGAARGLQDAARAQWAMRQASRLWSGLGQLGMQRRDGLQPLYHIAESWNIEKMIEEPRQTAIVIRTNLLSSAPCRPPSHLIDHLVSLERSSTVLRLSLHQQGATVGTFLGSTIGRSENSPCVGRITLTLTRARKAHSNSIWGCDPKL